MSMEKATRTRLTTLVILLLVLATGSVLGIAVDRRLHARGAAADARWQASGEEDSSREGSGEGQETGESSRRRRLLVEQVGLTESQQERVDSIVAHHRGEMRALEEQLHADLREAYMPHYRELLEETRAEIKGVLTPDQRVAYDSLLVEHDRRREERRSRDSISDSRG